MSFGKWSIPAIVSGAASAAFLAVAAPAHADPEQMQIRLADTGYCLDGRGPGERENGTQVVLHDCFANDSEHYMNQRWVYLEETKQLKLADTDFCLDAGVKKDGKRVNGSPATLYRCFSGEYPEHLPDQQWTKSLSLAEEGTPSTCLDGLNPEDRQNGSGVRIWECLDHPNQKWTMSPQ